MVKRARLQILLAGVFACSAFAADTYLIRPVYSNVNFKITKWMVLPEQGQFREFSGTLAYDPAHPENSHVEITVQARSIDTKNEARDSVLRSDDFFDVERYPTLAFRSTEVRPNGPDSLLVIGDFTVHGTTKRITMPVKVRGVHDVPHVGKLAGFETTFTINRRDYGVNGARWGAVPGSLSDEVEIHLLVGAAKPSH